MIHILYFTIKILTGQTYTLFEENNPDLFRAEQTIVLRLNTPSNDDLNAEIDEDLRFSRPDDDSPPPPYTPYDLILTPHALIENEPVFICDPISYINNEQEVLNSTDEDGKRFILLAERDRCIMFMFKVAGVLAALLAVVIIIFSLK